MWVIYCKRNQVLEVLKLKGSYCWNLVIGEILIEESRLAFKIEEKFQQVKNEKPFRFD